jgi:hypothetical protein
MTEIQNSKPAYDLDENGKRIEKDIFINIAKIKRV